MTMNPATRKLRTGKGDWLIVGNAPKDVVVSNIHKGVTLSAAKKEFVDYLYRDDEDLPGIKDLMKKSFGYIVEIHAVFRISGEAINVTRRGGE